jgi:hypothetical protein
MRCLSADFSNRMQTAGGYLCEKYYLWGKSVEGWMRWAEKSEFPQFKYFSKPVYKICVKYVGPVAATAISFLASNLMFHYFIPRMTLNLIGRVVGINYKDEVTFWWAPVDTVFQMIVFGIPVMYAKYKNSQSTNLPKKG